jgi:phage shock protein E
MERGAYRGAILIPYDQIGARCAEVTTNKSASIGLYCRSGRRSGLASKRLQALGYTNVENLGGLQEARKRLEPGSP